MSTQFAPVWNNASVDFSCIKANVTDSNSGSNSTLLDLQVGGSSKFKVDKGGKASLTTLVANTIKTGDSEWNCQLSVNSFSSRYNTTTWTSLSPGYLKLYGGDGTGGEIISDGIANALSMRSGASAQTFRVYNTYTDASNYERAKIAWSSNVLQIGTEKAGTGSARALELQTDGTTRLTIDTSGFVYANGSKIGLGSFGAVFIETTQATSNVRLGFNNAARLQIDTANITILDPDIARIRFGSTSSFPAIKRNSAALNFRLADDSADCDITAKAATFSGNVTVSTVNIVTDTTTGTKIGTGTTQKLGFWNATPDVQPTTAVAAATLVGGGGNTITDTDTFDGYTLKQIVKALRNIGLLA